MRKITLRSARAAALAAGLLLSAGAPVLAGTNPIGVTIYALTSAQHLVSFDTTTPGTIDEDVTITGITAGQTLVGMDFRPATGALVALGYDQAGGGSIRLYTINLVTGAATAIGAGAVTVNLGAESAANIGLDFNPIVDRVRVVSQDINANLRLNPVTGAVVDGDPGTPGVQLDGSLAYAAGDLFAGRNPNVGAVAYSNSFIGATSTILYDADLDFSTLPGGVQVILSAQFPPNNGTLNTIDSDVNFPQLVDLDIDIYNDLPSGVQTGYTVATYAGGGGTFVNRLATINFTTATLTDAGPVGGLTTTPIVDIAVLISRAAPAVTGNIAYAVSSTRNLLTFDTDNPTFIRSSVGISGVAEPLIAGMSVRPLTGEVFLLGYDGATQMARLYTLNTTTAVATAVGAGPVMLALGAATNTIGFDFNPTVDRIRVVSSNDANFRLNPNDGTIAATDTNLSYAVGDPNAGQDAGAAAAAYTNSFSGSTTTTLFTIDYTNSRLTTQIPPNAGTLNTVGPLGIALSTTERSTGFDILFNPIGSTNTAYLSAATTAAPGDNLYTLNLTTGAATLVGRIGGGIAVGPLALAGPLATVWTGTQSTDWNTPGNWSTGAVPTTASNTVIPSGPTNQPTLTGSGGTALLTVLPGATLTLAAGSTFSLNGNLTVSGTLAGDRTSTTTVVKTTALTMGGTGSTTFGNLTTNVAGVSLTANGSGIAVMRLLNLVGNLTTNARPLTLLSDAGGTAMVINGAGVVVGNATVQRSITITAPGTPGLGYRHLSAPVSNTAIGDLTTTGFTAVVNGNYNTSPNPNAVVPYPNVYGFDETRLLANPNFGSGYFSPVGLGDPMTQGRGYSVYMPGTAKPDFVGTLGNGNVVMSGLTKTGATSKSGWHILGNPYPSPLDWDQVTVPAGMSPTAYVFRSSGGLNGTYSTRVNNVGGTGDLIGLGQGFFVQVTGAGPVSLTFTNAARPTTYVNTTNTNVYRGTGDPRPLAQLTLRRANQPADQDADAAYVYFQDGASAAVERGMDATKLRAEGEAASIFTLAGGQELAINGLGLAAAEAATVPLGVVLPVAGTYVLSAADLRNFAPGAVTLVDARTNTSYDLTQQPTVRFTAPATGADLTRFSLRFGRGSDVTAASTLSLDVYPNPVSRTAGLTVTALGIGQGTTADVALYDALGRIVLRQTVAVTGQSASTTLKTAGLRAGAYTLRLTTATGAPLTRQVVVE